MSFFVSSITRQRCINTASRSSSVLKLRSASGSSASTTVSLAVAQVSEAVETVDGNPLAQQLVVSQKLIKDKRSVSIALS
ncbi:hypothetical protein IFO70_33815 [Phormidium tenue FACHB-886]|nr:hypothetical protein [Phormidium tenue FACHB-886]